MEMLRGEKTLRMKPKMTNTSLLLRNKTTAVKPRRSMWSSWMNTWRCRLLIGLSCSLNKGRRAGQRRSWWRQGGVEEGLVGKGARSVGPRWQFGSDFPMLEYAVQGLYVAGAFSRQLIGNRALGVCGEGSSALTDVLGFAFQVFVQHVAAEGR